MIKKKQEYVKYMKLLYFNLVLSIKRYCLERLKRIFFKGKPKHLSTIKTFGKL